MKLLFRVVDGPNGIVGESTGDSVVTALAVELQMAHGSNVHVG